MPAPKPNQKPKTKPEEQTAASLPHEIGTRLSDEKLTENHQQHWLVRNKEINK